MEPRRLERCSASVRHGSAQRMLPNYNLHLGTTKIGTTYSLVQASTSSANAAEWTRVLSLARLCIAVCKNLEVRNQNTCTVGRGTVVKITLFGPLGLLTPARQLWCQCLITLSYLYQSVTVLLAYRQRGFSAWSVCVFCLFVTSYFCTTGYEAVHEWYQRLQKYESLKIKSHENKRKKHCIISTPSPWRDCVPWRDEHTLVMSIQSSIVLNAIYPLIH